ncbi:MAG: ABC transporter permease, partial [Clostridia bacterium]|nr:ABC transporter permease [Clostridia bacterium]
MKKDTGLRQFRTVLDYEFMSYMKNKVYVVTTLVFVALIGIGLFLPAIIDFFKGLDMGTDPADDPTRTVYIADESGRGPDAAFYAKALEGIRWEIADPAELDGIRTRINDGEARGAFVMHEPGNYTYILRRAGVASGEGAVVQNALDAWFRSAALAGYGLTDAQIQAFLSPSTLEQDETVRDTGKSMEQAYLYTYLLVMLLYMTVMLYGQMVATSVAGEKSNRAMEMLITSARPTSLMFGKVIGSGLAGLAQIGVLLAAAVGFYQFNADRFADITLVRSMFEMPSWLVATTILFYLIGYFMYAFLYGALGSLASRTEDINTSIMPIVLLLVAAMMVSIFGMINPEATYVTVCSFIPVLAPMVMFVRICMTDVPFWQVAVSVALMLGTTGLIGYLSARIYRIGVLMYGKPPRLSELVRTLRNDR